MFDWFGLLAETPALLCLAQGMASLNLLMFFVDSRTAGHGSRKPHDGVDMVLD